MLVEGVLVVSGRGDLVLLNERARDIPGAFKPDQYWNVENPNAHERTTGPEIWDQTDGRITHLVAQVIGDAAIRVDAVEVGPQLAGQEPGGDREILVVASGQTLAIGPCLGQRWREFGNSVFRRQRLPPGSLDGIGNMGTVADGR